MAQKAMLLRIGAELARDGGHSPIFDDGTFEYIPILESKPTIEIRTYRTIAGRYGGYFSDYMHPSKCDSPVHYDPYFGDVFTYGDSTKHQKELMKLRKGDLLVFYATLVDRKGTANQYIIGYFSAMNPLDPSSNESTLSFYDWSGPWFERFQTKMNPESEEGKALISIITHLTKTKDWSKITDLCAQKPDVLPEIQELANMPPEIQENAHFKRFISFGKILVDGKLAVSFTITAGDPSKSRLLEKPIPITDRIPTTYPFQLTADLAEAWHLYNKDGVPINMTKKVPHLVTRTDDVTHLKNFIGDP